VAEEEGTTEAREALPRAEGEARPRPVSSFELSERNRGAGKVPESLGMEEMRKTAPM
jgi:hypothetical protein